MKDTTYLLIGGGMAAFHAAKQIRRTDDAGSILLVSEEEVPPYDRPPLSKELLRGEKALADITYEDAAKLAEQRIDLALGVRVEALDPAAKTATLADGEVVRYEKALIATGGRPVRLPVPGAGLGGVHYLRTIADAEAIAAEATPGARIAVIGAGFIGLEVAAALTQRGAEVTVIETLPQIWARFASAELADYVLEYCSDRGIEFITGDGVSEIMGEGRVASVLTKAGRTVECDAVCIGIGIVPNVELAQAAGISVDNGIVVDDHMRTSAPDVWAAGDVISYPDNVFGKRRRVEHWGHAEYSGQVAGRNMAGADTPYDFLSYVWSDIFDLRIEAAGDESERDSAVVRGAVAEGSFTIVYLKEGRVTAYFAVNGEMRDFATLRRLIRMKKDVRGREADIASREFNLRELLA